MQDNIELKIIDPKQNTGLLDEERKLKELQSNFNPDDDRYVFEFRGVITDSDQKLKFMAGVRSENGRQYAIICAPPVMEEVPLSEISYLSRGKSNDSETPDNPLIWRFKQSDLDQIKREGATEASKNSF